MRVLIRWYCGVCKKEFIDYAPGGGSLKARCPECGNETDFEQIFELETLQVEEEVTMKIEEVEK